MQPIEYLNRTFGVDNNVSVPIFISLVVFITGGLSRIIIESINHYYTRRRQRISFRNIIIEIKKSAHKLGHNLQTFYPTLNEFNSETWQLKFSRINYLEVSSRLDYDLVYNSFKILFFFRCKRNKRAKAFNKIWAILGNLKYTESLIEDNLKNFLVTFNSHEKQYGEYLEALRKQHDKLHHETNGVILPKSEIRMIEYLLAQDKIWFEWQKGKNPLFYQNSFSKLVEPLHKLNNTYSDIAFTLEHNNILLPATYEFNEMVNILANYRTIFFNHFINYKGSKKILEKCLGLIK